MSEEGSFPETPANAPAWLYGVLTGWRCLSRRQGNRKRTNEYEFHIVVREIYRLDELVTDGGGAQA